MTIAKTLSETNPVASVFYTVVLSPCDFTFVRDCLLFRAGLLDGYLGDYPILDYARAKLDPRCELKLMSQFGEDGYGIGLPKGSPLKVSLEVAPTHFPVTLWHITMLLDPITTDIV